MLSWLIQVENNKGEVVFADFFTSTPVYIPMLLKIARLVNEKMPDGIIRVLSPDSHGVIGLREWEKDAKWLTFTDKKQVEKLADVARQVGLNYE